jgi:hypothetical protein
VGAALSYLGTMIREKACEDMGIGPDEQDVLNGFGILNGEPCRVNPAREATVGYSYRSDSTGSRREARRAGR